MGVVSGINYLLRASSILQITPFVNLHQHIHMDYNLVGKSTLYQLY